MFCSTGEGRREAEVLKFLNALDESDRPSGVSVRLGGSSSLVASLVWLGLSASLAFAPSEAFPSLSESSSGVAEEVSKAPAWSPLGTFTTVR